MEILEERPSGNRWVDVTDRCARISVEQVSDHLELHEILVELYKVDPNGELEPSVERWPGRFRVTV